VSETVAIDFSPERATTHGEGAAIVAVDVIRATTTAVTGVVLGRECYPVPSLEVAVPLAARLHRPLLVGELGGNRPYGFDLTNSPFELAHRTDVERPMILLSTSGTRLIAAPPRADRVYVACLRNWRAQAAYLAGRHERVVVLGAGTRGEFREEDQLCCAWIARELVAAGYAPHDQQTRKFIDRWADQLVDGMLVSHSVAYLRETGQTDDLDFVMTHVDDVDRVFEMRGNRVVMVEHDDAASAAGAPLEVSARS
jgi:2-phosphosulfolactate phosphatase